MTKQTSQNSSLLANRNGSVWISAVSSGDLLKKLCSINTTVPPRYCGRTKEHLETAAICDFLYTIAEANIFDYPLIVVRGEQPDFILYTPLNSIGIEITEAVRRSDAHAASMGIEAIRMINQDPSLNEAVSNEKAREIAEGKQPNSPGWERDEVEERWAEDMFSIIDKKKDKFSNYEKCCKNWLLIYDNLCSLMLKRQLATAKLALILKSSIELPFDKVFVEFGPQDEIAQFGSEVTFHSIRYRSHAFM